MLCLKEMPNRKMITMQAVKKHSPYYGKRATLAPERHFPKNWFNFSRASKAAIVDKEGIVIVQDQLFCNWLN